jgi:MerR family redox-sensitive transcriptional activator SoxR
VLRRVAFVRIAEHVGLSLGEAREAPSLLPDRRTPRAADWELISTAWGERLDGRIAMLEALRRQLSSCIG